MPYALAPSPPEKIFFSFVRGERVTRRSSRQSVRRDAASRRIHGTFAAPFRPTKLQRDFHKAQRRVGPREHAGDSRAAREESVRRGASGGEGRGGGSAKQRNGRETLLSAVKTHGVSYLFLLSILRSRLQFSRLTLRNAEDLRNWCFTNSAKLTYR